MGTCTRWLVGSASASILAIRLTRSTCDRREVLASSGEPGAAEASPKDGGLTAAWALSGVEMPEDAATAPEDVAGAAVAELETAAAVASAARPPTRASELSAARPDAEGAVG